MRFRFNEAKAAQVAAMVLKKRGGRMHYIKLIKLLYLIDREALIRWGRLVTTDYHVSMNHGPVGSTIYRLIVEEEEPKPIWSKYISPPLGEFEVELRTDKIPNDELSPAEERLIDEVYEQFGRMNRWDLIHDVMHKLPEWQFPDGSSIPISPRDILKAANEDPDEIDAIAKELKTMSRVSKVLSGAS